MLEVGPRRVGALALAFVMACAPPVSGQVTTDFRYDVLGRLLRSHDSQGRTVAYTYDAAGNRITLGNGTADGEIMPEAFSASSNRGGLTGLASLQAMRDLIFNDPASVHITQVDSQAFVQADLGAPTTIDHLDLAAPDRALGGGGVDLLNGAQVQYSQDAVTWTGGATVGAVAAGVYKTVALGGVQARYVRVVKSGAALGVGDLRLYATPKPANTAPVAQDDTRAKLVQGETTTLDPRANDSDADHDALTITAVSPASHGQTRFTATGVVHVPDANYVGDDSFTYTLSDDHGGFAVATIRLTYEGAVTAPSNRAPVAVDDIVSMASNSAITLDVLSNDTDPDDDTLTVSAVGAAAHGQVAIVNGRVVYTPSSGYVGTDSFQYTCTDSHGVSASATVRVTVIDQAGNHPPIAKDDFSADSPSEVPATIASSLMVLSNDTDPDDDPISITSFSTPAHGVLRRVTTYPEHLEYTPVQGYLGPDRFSYTISDGRGGSASANVEILVKFWTNYTPRAGDDVFSVPNYRPTDLSVYLNDYDPGADVLTIISVTTPSHGAVEIVGSMIRYTPVAGYLGADQFRYTVSDGRGLTATATVSLTVTGKLNPIAVDDTVTARYGESTTFEDLLANDSDPNGDPVSIVALGAAGHGSVSAIGNSVVYTPAAGYWGQDSFNYAISDGEGGVATAKVSVTIPIERSPVAIADSVVVGHDETTSLDVLANDSDPDGDPLTLASVSAPAHGTAVIANNAVLYTPAAGYFGPDTFSYVVADGRTGATSATVSVNVTTINHAPRAVADSYELSRNRAKTLTLRGNDIDADGDPLVITAASAPAHGTATIIGGGTAVIYTPASSYTGADSFTYTVSDGRGGQASASVSLSILANRAPTPADDVAYLSYGSYVQPLSIDVLANDTDPDGDALTLVSAEVPEDSTFSATVEGNQLVFSRIPGVGGASFLYTVADSAGAQSTARVQVYATQILVAQPDHFVVEQGGKISILTDMLANDSNYSGAPVTPNQFGAISGTPSGGVEYNAIAKTLTYTAYAKAPFTDTFKYTISDGVGGGSTGVVTVDVVAAVTNRPPQAGPTLFKVVGSVPTPLPELLSRAWDPDGDPLTISSTGQTGVEVVNGVIVFTMPAYVSGYTNLNYTLSDGRGGLTAASARIYRRTNLVPVTSSDSYVAQANVAAPMAVLLNDTDPDGDALTIGAIASPPAHGRVQIVDGRSLVYTALDGYGGPDVFVYTASDGNGGKADATVSVTVLNTPNTAPVAQNDGPVTVEFNTARTIAPLGNDSDPNGDRLTITAAGAPAHGKAIVSADGSSLTYTPTTGHIGADSFTYAIADGRGGAASATISVTVLPPPNKIPTAVADSYELSRNRPSTLTVRGNDSDLDGDPLAITAVSVPAHGAAVIVAGGAAVTYTPTSGYTGADSFTYTVSDGRGGQASASVSLSILANRAPTPAEDWAYVSYGPIQSSVLIDVLANDTDPDGDPLTLVKVDDNETSAIEVQGNQVVFNKDSEVRGGSFRYTVADSAGAQSETWVRIYGTQVTQAQPDHFVVQQGGQISILADMLANDSNYSGAPVTPSQFGAISGTPRGNVVYNATTKTLTYTARGNAPSTDTFKYSISDGEGGSATGVVTVDVVAAVTNRPPQAGPTLFKLVGGAPTPLPELLSRAWDPDGDPLTISIPKSNNAQVVDGVVVVTLPAAVTTYTSIQYTLSDGRGGVTTANAYFYRRPNLVPIASSDSYVAQANVATPMAVLANDTDPDGDTLKISAIVSPPAHGRVQIVDGRSLVYTALDGYSGPDALVYTLSDGNGGKADATVAITVTPAH